ncbi:MAG: hypothetical protein JWN03_5288 [Nocardia sp.]|uniref:hypothetical protein n=1 Tax=Nocardia sp. TaxID=1821 RepID=UPI00262DB1DC|nr:hypothetical protein [Nocardia sp.]MCU1645013.1 hypothetical protein [Nocardia sp.]
MHDDAARTGGTERQPLRTTVPRGWPDTVVGLLARYLPEGNENARSVLPHTWANTAEEVRILVDRLQATVRATEIELALRESTATIDAAAAHRGVCADGVAPLGMVTRESISNVSGPTDIDGAAPQFMIAGLTASA